MTFDQFRARVERESVELLRRVAQSGGRGWVCPIEVPVRADVLDKAAGEIALPEGVRWYEDPIFGRAFMVDPAPPGWAMSAATYLLAGDCDLDGTDLGRDSGGPRLLEPPPPPSPEQLRFRAEMERKRSLPPGTKQETLF